MLAADGLVPYRHLGRLATGRHTVGKWHERFATQRADGMLNELCSGAPLRNGDDQTAEMIGRQHSLRASSGCHSLEPAQHGQGQWGVGRSGRASMVSVRPAAAPVRDL
jgi:hypothetical protein